MYAEFNIVTQYFIVMKLILSMLLFMWDLLIKLGLNVIEKPFSPHSSFFVLVQLTCCHSATLWRVREEHWPVQSAHLPG